MPPTLSDQELSPTQKFLRLEEAADRLMRDEITPEEFAEAEKQYQTDFQGAFREISRMRRAKEEQRPTRLRLRVVLRKLGMEHTEEGRRSKIAAERRPRPLW